MQYKNLLSIAAVLCLGGKVYASDCDTFQNAVKYLNDEVSGAFKLDKCCLFNGIRCDEKENIVELRFNNLDKTKDLTKFIDEIANLKNLQYLDLANDNIKGAIPQSLCTITSLKNLNLSKNKLTGAIPFQCKDLQNLEQANFEGNADLTGFVPVFKNIQGCAYKNTGLCDLVESNCIDSGKYCTENDIIAANAINGNPSGPVNTYDGSETKSRAMNVYDDSSYNNYSYGYDGYNDYSYGAYDTSMYYGNNNNGYDYGYGYGDWGNTVGYDNYYYDSGNYGTGYADDYTGTGYSPATDFYGGYSSGYGNSSGGGSVLGAVFTVILLCALIGLFCFCCLCRTCCCGGSRDPSANPVAPPVISPNKPSKPQSTTVKIDDEPNPYIVNNGATPYAAQQSSGPYAAQQSTGPYGAQQQMQPPYYRDVPKDEAAEVKKTEE